MTYIPNRISHPLTDDERLAEQYIGRPHALLELAKETGNRTLIGLARELMPRPKKQKR